MSDYTQVYDGATKDTNQSVLAGSDFDSEFALIAAAINSKADGDIAKDPSGNEILQFASEASAINYLKVLASATGNAVQLAALGDDTDVDVQLVAKGAGHIRTLDEFSVAYTAASATTVIDASLPSWVKRIEIVLDGATWGGNQDYVGVQLGTSGGYVTSGYDNHAAIDGSPYSGSGMGLTNMLQMTGLTYDTGIIGRIVLNKLTGNIWMSEGWGMDTTSNEGTWAKGKVSLGGVGTQIRMILNNGGYFWAAGAFLVRYSG